MVTPKIHTMNTFIRQVGRSTQKINDKQYTIYKLDGCIVWNAHNTVLGEEALLIHIVPVGYAT